MNKKIVEKYFANQATPSETRKVLEWFESPEGKKYLQQKIESDSDLMDKKGLRDLISDLDSENLFSSITTTIDKRNKRSTIRRTDWLGYSIKAAAVIIVLLSASWITLSLNNYQDEQVVEAEPIHIQTGEDQHREITLNDGSEIRLNSNSEIVVSKDFMNNNREVTLYGEAYFSIKNNPEKPFIIQANQSSIEVLGTEFNVRSHQDEDNVQVAVVDGKVSFKNLALNGIERHSVILSKGQYGYMDIDQHSILVDDLAVDNYLAWKNGRFVFDQLNLKQVCTQLKRLYKVECNFETDELKNLPLTANFSNESLEKTLSVIALSLNIEFDLHNDQIDWLHKEGSSY